MIIKNIRPFGRFVPGDTIEIPDGTIFDTGYFVEEVKVTRVVKREVDETVTDLEPVKE